jgi:hypothetical protein
VLKTRADHAIPEGQDDDITPRNTTDPKLDQATPVRRTRRDGDGRLQDQWRVGWQPARCRGAFLGRRHAVAERRFERFERFERRFERFERRFERVQRRLFRWFERWLVGRFVRWFKRWRVGWWRYASAAPTRRRWRRWLERADRQFRWFQRFR